MKPVTSDVCRIGQDERSACGESNAMTSGVFSATSSAGGRERGTLVAFLEENLAPPRPRAFCERMGEAAWRETSSDEMLARAKRIAAALAQRGVASGDRVAIVGDNSVDWIAAAFGVLSAGGTLVPIFKTLADDQLAFILRDSEARVAFVESDAVAERIASSAADVPTIVFETAGASALSAFEALGTPESDGRAAEARSALTPEDLAVLIYTSGTTGLPKGVMLPHGSLLSNAVDTSGFLFDANSLVSPTLHTLPFAHVMALSGILTGVHNRSEQYVTRPEFLMADLVALRPRTLALVPRILERLLGAIHFALARNEAARAQLAAPALETARRFAEADVAGTVSSELRAEHELAERVAFAPLRAMLGLDRIELLGTGSAAMHPDVAKTYYGIGLPVSEGYGMTEAGPTVTISRRGEIRFGSVGRAIANVRIRAAADGEIEVLSPGLMRGYYHRDGESPLAEDGWYKTGDVGRIDADGFLWLTDRKKEIFKTTTGKFVAPARVESTIQRSIFIDQATVVGDGRAFPVALVSPNWPILRGALALGAEIAQADAARRDDVRAFLEREVTSATSDLAPFERVRYVSVLPRELTIADGELSPSLKTKRRVVETNYAEAIAAVYARGVDAI